MKRKDHAMLFDRNLFDTAHTIQNFTQEDRAILPYRMILYLTLLGKLAPLYYEVDGRTEEEFQNDLAIIPGMGDLKEHLQDIGGKGKPPRLYMPASLRISQARDIWPGLSITSVIIEHDKDKEFRKKVLAPKKSERDPEVWLDEIYHGEATAMCLIFTGRRQVGLGFKTVNAAEFPDYAAKAETGAKTRAFADLGIATADVLRADDAVIGDTPIDPNLLNNHAAAQTGRSTTRDRADAALAGSRQVTTRAQVAPLSPAAKTEPKPMMNETEHAMIQTISADLGVPVPDLTGMTSIAANTLIKELNAKAAQRTTEQKKESLLYQILTDEHLYAYLTDCLGFPQKVEEWSTNQRIGAQQMYEEWHADKKDRPMSKEQVDQFKGHLTFIAREHLNTFSERILGSAASQLNSTRATYLLHLLKSDGLVYELATQVDARGTEKFVHMHEAFVRPGVKIVSPFDLLYNDERREEYIDYCFYLVDHLTAECPSEAFIARHGDVYAQFLIDCEHLKELH